jgi:plasmid stabilization system protein ParE
VPQQVIVSHQAETQIRTIDAWWRRHRKDSPDLFAAELAEALSLLEVAPGAGRPYPHPKVKGLRRLHLPATRHHIYYLTGTAAVVVLAAWGAVKGSGPNFGDLR